MSSKALQQQQNGVNHTLNGNQIILVAKFDYKSKESSELDLRKHERLLLIDNSKNWWLVRKLDSDLTGYVPSNYVKREKKSLLEKIIPRRLIQNTYQNLNSSSTSGNQQQSTSLVTSPSTISANSSTQQSNEMTTSTSTKLDLSLSLSKAIVKHKYEADKADELTLNVGTYVNVLEKFADGWWRVCTENDNPRLVGLYPSNYLKEEPQTPMLSNNNQHQQVSPSQLKVSVSNEQNLNSPTSPTNRYLNDVKSNSSNEREIEYLRVIYPFKSIQTSELSVQYNEIVKLVDEDSHEEAWIKVFNSQGIVGFIPSNCVEPFIETQVADFVFVRTPTSVGPFANKKWYFGNITRFETILLLNKYAHVGDYLVRDSENGNFSISLKSEGNTNNKHFKVLYKENRFVIGKKVFNTMQELLDHYHNHPIFDQNSERLYLRKPFEPPSFDSIFMKTTEI